MNHLRQTILVISLSCWFCSCHDQAGHTEKSSAESDDITNLAFQSIDSLSPKNSLASANHNPQPEAWFNPDTLDTLINCNDKIRLHLKVTEAVPIPQYYLDNKTIDSLNKQFDNTHQKALAVENILKKSNGERMKRQSGLLNLKLKSGDWKPMLLNEEVDEADCTFEHFFSKYGFYSVRVQLGEGETYRLVNYRTGKKSLFRAAPIFLKTGSLYWQLTVILKRVTVEMDSSSLKTEGEN